MLSATTLPAPKARTDRARQTALSMPPETPSTTPRRCRSRATCSRMRLVMCSTSASPSSSSTSGLSCLDTDGPLAFDVGGDAIQAVQILRDDLLVGDADAEAVFQEVHQLEDSCRIQQVVGQERSVVADRFDVFAHHHVVGQVASDVRLDVHGTSPVS